MQSGLQCDHAAVQRCAMRLQRASQSLGDQVCAVGKLPVGFPKLGGGGVCENPQPPHYSVPLRRL
jgi:hypothetical protein